MSEAGPPRLSKTALLAFVLGLCSLSPLSIVTALPALYFGIQGVRAVNRSDGRLWGQRLAVAGLLLGAVVTLAGGIGLVAMGLLFVQEKNYRAGCTNNLRQIGQAIQRYSDHHDHVFPPGTVPNAALKPARRLSWQAALVPFLAEGRPTDRKWEKLAETIDFQEAWDAPANAGLRCNAAPSLCPAFARQLAPGRIGLTSYIGIAGVGRDAATLPLSDPNAGFFGYDRLLHPSDITARLAATMAAIETCRDNGPWPAGGPATVRGLEPDSERYIGTDTAFGGLHRDGANVLWADGSVRIVTEEIDPDLLRRQARIAR